jgi:hypothetical protein
MVTMPMCIIQHAIRFFLSQCSKSKKTNEKLFKNQRHIKKLPKELPLALGSADLGLLGIVGRGDLSCILR